MKAKTSYDNLRAKISLIHNLELFNACEELFTDPRYSRFERWPAALKNHHCGAGGLADHTKEVMEYAIHIALPFPKANNDVLIAAALWHDLTKIWEYEADPTIFNAWVEAPYKNLIYHIAGSHAEFVAVAAKHGVSQELTVAIGHAILAHHGPVKEWGSPVAPQTLEAQIIHQADMLSARYGPSK